MAIQPTQPQGIGGVLDTSFQLYKASVGAVWPLCLLSSILASPPSIYLMVKGAPVAVATPQAAMDLLAAMVSPTYVLIYLLSTFLVACALGAIYIKEQAIGMDAPIGLGEALKAAWPRAFWLLIAGILYLLAMLIGSVLLLIPGLILSVSLILCVNLILFENKGPIAGLIGSHQLIWGNWWRTTALLTVGMLLMLVIYMAVGLVAALLVPFIGLGAANALMFSATSTLVIGVIMNVLVMPFFVALLIATYWDLKLRKEGGDLAARVGALNAA